MSIVVLPDVVLRGRAQHRAGSLPDQPDALLVRDGVLLRQSGAELQHGGVEDAEGVLPDS